MKRPPGESLPLRQSEDLPMEVEYGQGVTFQDPIGGMEVTPSGLPFYLGVKPMACLVPEECGVDGTGCC